MIKMGVIHGRFQLLHNDHLKYLLAGKEKCEHLVVGITNPDPTLTSKDSADSHRSNPSANPFTYYERSLMVRAVLTENGISLDDFTVVPFPINFPELYKYYLPLDATFFLTIYDQWGEKKLSIFESIGLKTEILWRRPLDQKGLSSSDIRQLIVDSKPWEHLVPQSVAQLIKSFDLPSRV